MVTFLLKCTPEPPPGLSQALPASLASRCLTGQIWEAWCPKEGAVRGFSWPCPPSPPSPRLQVRIWEIPEGGLKRNMTEALLELHGHSRRVGLVEWHPTTNNILFSAGYDYKVSC